MSSPAGGLLIETGLPESPTTQDPEIYAEVAPLYTGVNRLAIGLDQVAGAIAIAPTESIAIGGMVNVHNSGGAKARKANATDNTKIAHAVCLDTNGLIVCSGIVDIYTGLTPGATYYLSKTAGQITVTKPTGAGAIVQIVGFALSATELYVNPHLDYVQL